MKALSVFCSDEINKKNLKMTISAMEKAIVNSINGFPVYFGHNHHKPIGWTQPLGLVIEPSIVKALGEGYIAENAIDEKKVKSRVLSYEYAKELEDVMPFKNELDTKLSQYYTGNKKYCNNESAAVVDRGIVRRVFPDLFKNEDKKGLIDITNLNPIAPGVFKIEDFVVFAHNYYRRSLSRLNSLNIEFLELLQKTSENKDLKVKIALDEDLIGLVKSYGMKFEFQYWRGPYFTDNLSVIPDGVTIYEASEDEKLFMGVSSTELGWYFQDGKRTFECEEIADEPSYGISNDHFGCRYVHSMLDDSTNYPIHLDGAIRLYDEEKMASRLEIDIKHAPKNTKYTKLWRVDGQIEVSLWKRLIGDYYRDNSLVGEYLEGKQEKSKNEVNIPAEEVHQFNILNYIPKIINPGDGVRLLISYKKHHGTNYNNDVYFEINECIYDGENEQQCIDNCVVGLIKLLKSDHIKIDLDGDINFIEYNDLITNFATVKFQGKDSFTNARIILNNICKICESWAGKGQNRLISFNLGLEYEQNDIYFSYIGYVNDILKWFKDGFIDFPTEEDKMGNWCEQTAVNMKNLFNNDTKMDIKRVLNENGTFTIPRHFLSEQKFKSNWDKEKQCEVISLQLKKEEIKFIRKNNIGINRPCWIKKSKCSKCGHNYRDCNCIKEVDENVREIILEKVFLSPYWIS
ncbi:hypothetical protein P343_09880 [Sporolactobacillus laevolacticus DSM 442]|uniref:Uncharacterized protein n=2 Tax=Sporolactobacillus laevolacticus TaxID=33018 RepID=V6IYX7_9BACL|nr:hypothetical protein P343_09880 [Sporolactobacillus laevolacticus DSM 442]